MTVKVRFCFTDTSEQAEFSTPKKTQRRDRKVVSANKHRAGRQKTKKAEAVSSRFGLCFYPGGDLRSHTVARAVSSALRGLTSVFGMGTGVTPAV
jgi:hypothetical protein